MKNRPMAGKPIDRPNFPEQAKLVFPIEEIEEHHGSCSSGGG